MYEPCVRCGKEVYYSTKGSLRIAQPNIDLGMYADIDDAAKVVEEYKQQCRLVGDII